MSHCCICGHEADEGCGGLLVNGRTAPICNECAELLDSIESSDQQNPQREEQYAALLGKMKMSGASNAVIEAVTGIANDMDPEKIRDYIETEEKEAEREKQEEEERQVREAAFSSSKTSGFIFTGVLFLVAAIVFYILSVRDVGYGIQVANIQMTVFAAACFLAGIINFVAVGIVNAINGSK